MKGVQGAVGRRYPVSSIIGWREGLLFGEGPGLGQAGSSVACLRRRVVVVGVSIPERFVESYSSSRVATWFFSAEIPCSALALLPNLVGGDNDDGLAYKLTSGGSEEVGVKLAIICWRNPLSLKMETGAHNKSLTRVTRLMARLDVHEFQMYW